MKTARELYPELADRGPGFYGPCDYDPILQSFGEVVVKVEDKDYQGDTRVLYRDAAGRYGVLVFGWGSCSGCDALQACDNLADIDKLIAELAGQVRWGTAEETLRYVETHDWEGDWSGLSPEVVRFVDEAKAALGAVGKT